MKKNPLNSHYERCHLHISKIIHLPFKAESKRNKITTSCRFWKTFSISIIFEIVVKVKKKSFILAQYYKELSSWKKYNYETQINVSLNIIVIK